MSVFIFDIKGSTDVQLEVARAAVKRLKTLRHPSILTYIDSTEVGTKCLCVIDIDFQLKNKRFYQKFLKFT